MGPLRVVGSVALAAFVYFVVMLVLTVIYMWQTGFYRRLGKRDSKLGWALSNTTSHMKRPLPFFKGFFGVLGSKMGL